MDAWLQAVAIHNIKTGSAINDARRGRMIFGRYFHILDGGRHHFTIPLYSSMPATQYNGQAIAETALVSMIRPPANWWPLATYFVDDDGGDADFSIVRGIYSRLDITISSSFSSTTLARLGYNIPHDERLGGAGVSWLPCLWR